jgi:antitoxin VapB
MGLSIKNDETERLVRELAKRKGVGVTTAVRLAVTNELKRASAAPDADWQNRWADIKEIQRRSQSLRPIDDRSDEDILGYGDDGLPS